MALARGAMDLCALTFVDVVHTGTKAAVDAAEFSSKTALFLSGRFQASKTERHKYISSLAQDLLYIHSYFIPSLFFNQHSLTPSPPLFLPFIFITSANS